MTLNEIIDYWIQISKKFLEQKNIIKKNPVFQMKTWISVESLEHTSSKIKPKEVQRRKLGRNR